MVRFQPLGRKARRDEEQRWAAAVTDKTRDPRRDRRIGLPAVRVVCMANRTVYGSRTHGVSSQIVADLPLTALQQLGGSSNERVPRVDHFRAAEHPARSSIAVAFVYLFLIFNYLTE